MNTQDRIAALRKVADETGADITKAFEAVAPSWALSPFEEAEIRHLLATNPPPSATDRTAAAHAHATARAEADKQEQTARVARIADARRHRELAQANPFLAATDAAAQGYPKHFFDPDDGSGGGPQAA